MKKITPIIISLIMLLSGCAVKTDLSGSEYVGKWQAVKIVSTEDTIKDELEIHGGGSDKVLQHLIESGILLPDGKLNLAGLSNSSDLSDTTLTLKKDGVSVMEVYGRATTGYWEEMNDGIKIIGRSREYKATKNDDGTITVERYGAIITYKKL
ncbi:MAG: hypothetical protein J6E46_01210 [Faecalicoccus sp.]|nr:hypothetical protein [Faecalicoccus sp.]